MDGQRLILPSLNSVSFVIHFRAPILAAMHFRIFKFPDHFHHITNLACIVIPFVRMRLLICVRLKL